MALTGEIVVPVLVVNGKQVMGLDEARMADAHRSRGRTRPTPTATAWRRRRSSRSCPTSRTGPTDRGAHAFRAPAAARDGVQRRQGRRALSRRPARRHAVRARRDPAHPHRKRTSRRRWSSSARTGRPGPQRCPKRPRPLSARRNIVRGRAADGPLPGRGRRARRRRAADERRDGARRLSRDAARAGASTSAPSASSGRAAWSRSRRASARRRPPSAPRWRSTRRPTGSCPQYRELAGQLWHGYPLRLAFLWHVGHPIAFRVPDDLKMLPFQAAIAGQLPQAAGLAWGLKLKGDPGVVLAIFGDGGTSQGDFHEAAEPRRRDEGPDHLSLPEQRVGDLHERRAADRVRDARAEGGRVRISRASSATATTCSPCTRRCARRRARAREGEGPTLVEAVTYRLGLHTTADDPTPLRAARDPRPVGQPRPAAAHAAAPEGDAASSTRPASKRSRRRCARSCASRGTRRRRSRRPTRASTSARSTRTDRPRCSGSSSASRRDGDG